MGTESVVTSMTQNPHPHALEVCMFLFTFYTPDGFLVYLTAFSSL